MAHFSCITLSILLPLAYDPCRVGGDRWRMNQPQRYLIVAFLCGIAAAGPIFCLQYRSTDYWGTGGRVFNVHFALPIPPIIALSETEVVPPNRSRHPLSSMSDEELKAAYVNLTYCEGLGTGDARN